MRKHLEEVKKNPQMEKTIKHCVYLNRIQRRIEREMNMMLWLAINYPEVLLDEEREYKDDSGKIVSHRRLKKLLLTLKALNPKCEVELVLRQIDFPENEETIEKCTNPDCHNPNCKGCKSAEEPLSP